MKKPARAADEEAPPQGGHQHEFRQPGDLPEDIPQNIFAQGQADDDEQGGLGEIFQDAQDLRIGQGGLKAQDHDGPDILKHQDAQGKPAGQGAQFKLLIEQFHDDGGAAQGQAHRQVEQIVLAAQDLDAEDPVLKGFADGKPQQHEETETHGGAEDELENACGKQGFARFSQLVEVEFQPDHE